jgi:hypothetical protein
MDLDKFISLSSIYSVGKGFTTRPSTLAEQAKCSAGHALFIASGGSYDGFWIARVMLDCCYLSEVLATVSKLVILPIYLAQMVIYPAKPVTPE